MNAPRIRLRFPAVLAVTTMWGAGLATFACVSSGETQPSPGACSPDGRPADCAEASLAEKDSPAADAGARGDSPADAQEGGQDVVYDTPL